MAQFHIFNLATDELVAHAGMVSIMKLYKLPGIINEHSIRIRFSFRRWRRS